MTSLHLSQVRKWLLSSPPLEWAILQLRELLIGALRQGPIPQHVAFVMDGNRRFARTNKIETVEGHNLGFEALARILEVCYKSGVKVVTVYAFSIENFNRSKYEVDALMDMAKVKLSQLAQHGDLLDRYGACIRVLGQKSLVKPDVQAAIDRAVELTCGNTKAVLNVCFPYTSRDEITTAIRETVVDYSKPHAPFIKRPFSESHIVRNIRAQHLSVVKEEQRDGEQYPVNGDSNPYFDGFDHKDASSNASTTLNSVGTPNHPASFPDPETITAQTLTDHMFTAGCPPLDLLIRTSGVERLSDFMLWQCHQDTQIVFLDCLWPEFDLWTFLPVLVEWQWRMRKASEEGKGAARVKAA